MQTTLAPEYAHTPDGLAAQRILRQCVHCGFCTATCPTYQLLGDELDGPRGRIYQIKQIAEGQAPTRQTQLHLDRCLTCRNCETTCPSGVEYGQLLDIGRSWVDAKVPRPLPERALRWLLRKGLTSPLFAPAMRLGQWVRPVLPQVLQAKVPRPRPASPSRKPLSSHARQIMLHTGCVQDAMQPNINAATIRVLDAAGIQTLIAPNATCCGAINQHLGDSTAAQQQMRANIDAWWPDVESGKVQAILSNASGCGVLLKDYGHLLADDAAYASKAQRISAITRDVSELLADVLPALLTKLKHQPPADAQDRPAALPKLVYHPPCTLQHGQKIKGGVEDALRQLGFDVQLPANESHLCCGSAGTYSILQSNLSNQLKARKLGHIHAQRPQIIISSNIGCISHLQSGTTTPVWHWIEVLDTLLSGRDWPSSNG